MNTHLLLRLGGLLAALFLLRQNSAHATSADDLREEARDLFDQKKYADSAQRWNAVAPLEAAAGHAADAYWAYWRAAICETKTGDFAKSAEHFALADDFLQTAKANAGGAERRTNGLNQIALRNGWDTACFSDGRVGLGLTVHQRAWAAMTDYLRQFHPGDLTIVGVVQLRGHHADRRVRIAHLPNQQP